LQVQKIEFFFKKKFLSRSSFFGLVGLQKWKIDSLKKNKSIFVFAKNGIYDYFSKSPIWTCKTKNMTPLKNIPFFGLAKKFHFVFQGFLFLVLLTHKTKKWTPKKKIVELFVRLLLLFSRSSFFGLLNLQN
jgi:hypothetical protein